MIWEPAARRPRILSCSIIWPACLPKTVGRSKKCTAGSCCRTCTSRPASRIRTLAGAILRTACCGGCRANAWKWNRCGTPCWPFPASWTRATMGGRPFDLESDPVVPRRSVYAFINRDIISSLSSTFDGADPTSCTVKRPDTTVPQQTLYALNSAFIQDRAAAVAKLACRRGRSRWRPSGMVVPADLSCAARSRRTRLGDRLCHPTAVRRRATTEAPSRSGRRSGHGSVGSTGTCHAGVQ